MKTLYLVAIAIVVTAQAEQSVGRDHFSDRDRPRQAVETKPELVNWLGIIHSQLDNDVELEFIRKSDGDKFDIVDSKELEALDWKDHRSRLVQIEAEKTPRFLFWGGNLVVKKFEVLKETGRYKMPKKVANRGLSRFSDRR